MVINGQHGLDGLKGWLLHWIFESINYRKDVQALERVRKRFMGMLPGLDSIYSRERLRKIRLLSLEIWRLNGNLIEVNKIMKGIDRVEFLSRRIEMSNSRGHSFKVRGGSWDD